MIPIHLRPLFPVACLLLLATPLGLAHDPPGPVLGCEPASAYHDYLPPGVPNTHVPADGNTQLCDPSDPTSAGYDGDLDHGYGGVTLFVLTGDGATSGVAACYLPGSVGHHSNTVYALDASGNGPSFSVFSDASRVPPPAGPDCGDGLVEPCLLSPPPLSDVPFPLNIVFDHLHLLEWMILDILLANGYEFPRCDFLLHFPAVTGAPSGGHVPFEPGLSGAYEVWAPDWGVSSGHVWTTGTYSPPTYPACYDGLDNDGDGRTDYPMDFECWGPFDTGELHYY